MAGTSLPQAKWLLSSVVMMAFFLALSLVRPALGQTEPPGVAAADHTPWPVLDDGRVVLTLFDVKIAMPTCARCLEYTFRSDDPRGSVSSRYNPTVRDVIAHPERLRYIANNSEIVWLELGNDWRPEVNRGPFLGRVDPKSLPWTAYLWLRIYKHSRAEPCWTDLQPDEECKDVHNLDVFARRDDQVVEGMSVIKGPCCRDAPGFAGGTVVGTRDSLYLAPTDHAPDAIGLPVRVLCNPLKMCENSAFGVERGFALRRDVDLLFTFQENDYPPSEWVALHDRTVNAVRSLLLDP